MIPATRFIECSDNRDAWLTARRPAITATAVAKAATPSGFLEVAADRANPVDLEPNDYMRFGTDNEDWIARVLKEDFGLFPNHWLIAAEGNPLHMATPDCLSLDHTVIGEIKTGGKEPNAPSRVHRDQMQWQMWCTGAVEGIYAFMLRKDTPNGFMPAWITPKTWPVLRDEKRITELLLVAGRLLELDERIAA